MSFEASCPACGSPIRFDVDSSVVTVCESCRSLVGRADGALEDFGKVANLVQTDSPVQIGLRGKFRGKPFEVVGRSQIRHAAGGVWDEWYLAFRGGQTWGWLAEAQGRLYVTFEQPWPDALKSLTLDDLAVESGLAIPKYGTMTVAETGEAQYISAEGEIPFRFQPGAEIRYADLSGPGRKFATIDFTDEAPVLYAGVEVTHETLGIADAIARLEAERRVATAHVKCPQCAAPLELTAPDETLRVVCQYCGAMSDTDQGELKYLETLKEKVEPLIPLGTRAKIPLNYLDEGAAGEAEYTVIGFMRRETRFEKTTYFWYEYLLYRPRAPFAWLVHSEGHWSLVEGIPAGEVKVGAKTLQFHDRTHLIFAKCEARVSYVLGEFYWRVQVGERAKCVDFVRPPYVVSREVSLKPKPHELRAYTDQSAYGEVNYSQGRYVDVKTVSRLFGVKKLPSPRGVAPNQPYAHKGVYRLALGMLIAAFLLIAVAAAFSTRKQVLNETFVFPPGAAEYQFSRSPFELHGHRNLRITVKDPNYAYVLGQLYNEETRETTDFSMNSGESVYLSSPGAGRYTLRVQGSWDQPSTVARSVQVTATEGVLRVPYIVFLLLGILVVPFIVGLHHITFEMSRWSESDFAS